MQARTSRSGGIRAGTNDRPPPWLGSLMKRDEQMLVSPTWTSPSTEPLILAASGPPGNAQGRRERLAGIHRDRVDQLLGQRAAHQAQTGTLAGCQRGGPAQPSDLAATGAGEQHVRRCDPEGMAQRLGVSKLSDLKRLDKSDLTFCVESEFASRNDGFVPMLQAYNLTEVIDTGLLTAHPELAEIFGQLNPKLTRGAGGGAAVHRALPERPVRLYDRHQSTGRWGCVCTPR